MISVDISNIWGEVSLPDLLGLEAEVFEAHNTLMEGTGAGAHFRGWLKLPSEEPGRILESARRIRENSDVLVVIGADEGCLGARAAMELLQGPNRNMGKGKGDPQILFAGNSFSTRHWNELLRLLEGKDFSLCVISRYGTDLESAIALRNLKWLLERKYGTDESRKRIYVVTDGEQGTLRQMAAEEGWESFSMPASAAGQFAVLSPAGLLPMAAAGIDISEVLQGALEAKEEYDLRSYENPVWLYAAVRNLMYRNGKAMELLSCFEPGFRAMGCWWQQLFGGAEGKSGKGLYPVTAELTGDLYSLGQSIQEGQRNLFETMIRFAGPEAKMVIGEEVKDLDGLNYLAGCSLEEVEEKAFFGIMDAHVDGGVPVVCVDCAELNERKLGELFWFFQLSCAISAYMLGVDPFDRSGAEVWKENVLSGLGNPGCAG